MMGFGSKPAPAVAAPPPVTMSEVDNQDDVLKKDRDARRRMGAVNSMTSVLSDSKPANAGYGGKSLLGQ